MSRRALIPLVILVALSLACGQVSEMLGSAGNRDLPVTTVEVGAPSETMMRQWATGASATTQYGDDSWAASQATLAPDTYPECGDVATAWASQYSDGIDSLVLSYVGAVIPTQINIYETYNPGAILRVWVAPMSSSDFTLVFDAGQMLMEPPTCPNILSVEVSGVDFLVGMVKIDLDQSNHTGWNEIDAVELVGVLP